ncbi:unnamed protein product [Penicillium camemberti]|uniref:Str. FM013 n=1 Tax=Penicillium camemberti (strain FM 013) TaxID=1429867 RepID=A0A0G4NXQ2_PENC3|nr:unnamed protein product [Penicillium camemberti]
MGLNRGIVSSPFQDWEFVLQDKIPATVGLMHNILQSDDPETHMAVLVQMWMLAVFDFAVRDLENGEARFRDAEI